MNKRIAKKRAARFSASCLSLPMVLEHALPSFWRLDHGAQRHFLAERMSAPFGSRGLGVARDVARYVARSWERSSSASRSASPQ